MNLFYTLLSSIKLLNKYVILIVTFLINFQLDAFSVTDSLLAGDDNSSFQNISGPPIFTKNNYIFEISEQANLSAIVGAIAADDPDGDAVSYSIINGNTNKTFIIDPVSGSIIVSKELNHHTQSQYMITARATDATNLFSDVAVTINILGNNQIPPFTTINWTTAAKQPMNTHEVHGEVVHGKLYIFGGYNPNKTPSYIPTQRSFMYDPAINKWSSIADLPHTPKGSDFGGVTHDGLATDGTDIYIAGGYTANSSGTGQIFGTRQVWKYNVVQNNYTSLPSLPIELAAGQLRYLNGKLHFMGGTNISRQDVAIHYALDLDNLAAGWKLLAPLSNPRNHGGSQIYEGKIYFIGGAHGQDDASIPQNTVEAYDDKTDTWTQVASLPVPRDHISSAVVVMGNRIIVMGGKQSHSKQIDLVSAYSPDNNTWGNLTPLTATKAAGVGAVLNGALYYTGGNFSNTNRKGIVVPDIVTQAVDSFTLINADNGQSIKTIADNDIINLSILPSVNLNIRANTNPATVGSVAFSLAGAETKNITENIAPYALFGDDKNGTYYSWTPTEGSYNLVATPFTSTDGGGTAGTALSKSFRVINDQSQSFILNPVADSYVRNGTYSGKNYGSETSFLVKGSPNSGFTRYGFLKFDLKNIPAGGTAILKIFGSNVDNNSNISITLFGVNDDSWTETGIVFNNQPTNITSALGNATVNNQQAFYEFDVTNFVNSEIAGDKIVSFVMKDLSNKDKIVSFNSRENNSNVPQLIISGTGTGADTIPPTVDLILNGTLVSPNTYHEQVQISINASDDGGSGLAFTRYSLNNSLYENYAGPFLINTPGTYTIIGVAGDGAGNITQTNQVTFTINSAASITLLPISDASVRDGAYANKNYGNDTAFLVKASPNTGFTRVSYLKFSLGNINNISNATLRIYGNNTVDNSNIGLSCFGVNTDSWSENTITWNNAPALQPVPLSSGSINAQLKYYDFDVTDFVSSELSGDKIVSLAIKDPATVDKILSFRSKENSQNKPQLVINTNNAGNVTTGEAGDKGKLKVYPNPLRDKFFLEFPASYHGKLNIEILDINGRSYKILNNTVQGRSAIEINIAKYKLSKGTYYLRIQSDQNKTEEIKFIVQ